MKLRVLIWLALFLGLGTGSRAQQLLIWQDEFDGQGHVDSTRWNYEVGGHGWGNEELQFYTHRRLKNARQENGRLIIEAHKESYQGSDYTSARLTTKNKGDWVYGRMEVRAKLPEGRGTWPAIWMLPTEWIYGDGGWPDNGEMDIMEHVGWKEGIIHGTIHTDAYNHMQGTQRGDSIEVPDAMEAFHVYAIEWTASEIRWYVDDQLYFTYENEGEGWQKWPFDHPFHMLLNIAIGGTWGGVKGVDNSIFPVRMEVDYVRVYQSPDQIDEFIEGPARVAPRQRRVVFSSKVHNAASYEWEVPDGAQVVGGAGEKEIAVNWGCRSGEIRCTIHAEGDVYHDTLEVEVGPPHISGPMFYSASDDPLLFSVEEMSQTTYQWSVPEGATVLSGEGTDSLEVDWPERADSLSLQISNSCGNYTIHHKVWAPGRQYPYPDPKVTRILPDTIDPTHYDYGGEGVAYHDWNTVNEGQGVRQDEGVDTQLGDQGHGSIGWINDGEWVEYTFRVEQETTVKVILRMASAEQTNGSVDVLINGEKVVSSLQAGNTGGWDRFEGFESSPITLSPADSLLRLEFNGSNFNLGRIILSQVETGIQEERDGPSFHTFPNPADAYLNLASSEVILEAEVFDLAGTCIHKTNLENSRQNYRLDFAALPAGMYLVRVTFADGHIRTRKFLKK
ncbi:MAG: family 16 glycosylhydrolase [Bacteroidales bacterium]|nr:family 16 glycosylhydrolase [Bacteroidales bacterium]